MSRIGKSAVVALCALLLSPLLANAATVTKRSGAVLVNKGQGFVEVLSEAEIAPGQQVMVRPGGSASIAYAGNCVVRVGSGLWWVQAASPCTNGATEIDFTGRMNQATQPTDADATTGTFVVSGALIGGAITAGVVISKNGDKPASP